MESEERRILRLDTRWPRKNAPTLRSWEQPGRDHPLHAPGDTPAVVDCGWGRLVFAHTCPDPETLLEVLEAERGGGRDIAFYVRDPQVVLARAPHAVFLDPSHTYRLWLDTYRPSSRRPRGFTVRHLRGRDDADAVNVIYAARDMVPVPVGHFLEARTSRTLVYLVAEEAETGTVLGTVTGVDHERAFGDPEQGFSLWCLAVARDAPYPGIGEALVRTLAEYAQAHEAAFLDLSVMHDNEEAIALYEKLGFQRVPVFTLKRKNEINESLFVGPGPESDLNPYARIIVDEARRRGIAVEILDVESGTFRLTTGARSIVCRESLSITSAVAMSLCDDKAATRRVLAAAGLAVPEQRRAGSADENAAFLERHGSIVVKPARGEQGRGVVVDLRTPETVERAVAETGRLGETVLLEAFAEGEDLRVLVIDDEVVAAAIRRPAEVAGTGQHTIRELVERQSRRRSAATEGESAIPLDDETERCVAAAGHALDDVLPEGTHLAVRRTANLHTGGTIHDVTDRLHPEIHDACLRAAEALDIPVVGLDLLVPDVEAPAHVFLEANERPGLANHEPRPTAECFLDLLFPQTADPGRG